MEEECVATGPCAACPPVPPVPVPLLELELGVLLLVAVLPPPPWVVAFCFGELEQAKEATKGAAAKMTSQRRRAREVRMVLT
jgi:hypothetical protein